MTVPSQLIDRLAAALGGGAAARLAAAALLEAEAGGQTRFGLALLEEWAADAPAPPPGRMTGPVAWRDISGSFAPLAVAAAVLEVAETARLHGIAALFLRGVKGFGRLAPFVRHLADQGLVGLAAAEGPPFVAPHGGAKPVIGTNPLALAMGRGPAQIVIDTATSTATMADIRNARAVGAALPPGVGIDATGRPTQIAAEVVALLPRGGLIGSALGLVVELLAGVLADARGAPGTRGVFLLAIDPEAEGGGRDWLAKLQGLRHDWGDGGGHWPGGGAALAPGLPEAELALRLDRHLSRMAGVGGC